MPEKITRENSIPRKSKRYYLGEAVIRSQFNDIEFYFEDKDQQEMYFSIMQKLFGEKIKFEKVFITCGKNGAYTLLDGHRNSKKKIFVLDKDFDDLLRTKKRGVGNVFYLDRYSIESFLLEEDAIRSFIIARNPTFNRNSLSLPYSSLMAEVVQELRLLTSYFFIAKKYKISDYIPGFKSCSLSVIGFLEPGNPQVSNSKILAYWQKVEHAITTHMPDKNPSELLESAKRSIDYSNTGIDGVFRHIPGKHCLELLRNKITRIYPTMRNEQTATMMFGLAERCTFNSLAGLKNDISSYLDAA